MRRRGAGRALLFAVAAASACLGPKPRVGGVTVRPPEGPDDAYLLEVRVVNDSRGQGEVDVVAKLRDRRTGLSYGGERKLQLDPHEDALVTLRIVAPSGDYATSVRVEYPPP